MDWEIKFKSGGIPWGTFPTFPRFRGRENSGFCALRLINSREECKVFMLSNCFFRKRRNVWNVTMRRGGFGVFGALVGVGNVGTFGTSGFYPK